MEAGLPRRRATKKTQQPKRERESMPADITFETINEAKANLDHIYDQPDPRAYFRELGKLGYVIPGVAKPIFQKLISHLRRLRSDPVNVLDLGCSYGINAALLKYDLSMSELYEHWCDKAPVAAPSEDIVRYDQRFFDGLDPQEDISVVGFDLAESAVAFAEKTGLLDTGHAINLETEPLPETAADELASVDLMISTGCIGYVTERSFERLLPAVTRGQSPWIGNFVLRMFPFDAIEETLKDWGYVTEKLEGRIFLQRRFASDEERELMLKQLHLCGVDPTGKEEEGQLLAEFYLSRPAEEAEEIPIERLLAA
jgi:SAM-dependent methyltransferase